MTQTENLMGISPFDERIATQLKQPSVDGSEPRESLFPCSAIPDLGNLRQPGPQILQISSNGAIPSRVLARKIVEAVRLDC